MIFRIAVVVVMLAAYHTPSFADDEQESPQQLPHTPLLEVLDAVSKKSEKVFLVDRKVHPDVVLGQADPKRMDYATLLIVLRNNGLAAVNDGEAVSIINVTTIRQYALPVIPDLDQSIHAEEWVTMIIKVHNAHAPAMIPILRPMLPQQGLLISHPESNTITAVDRYGNLKRVVTVIRKMDAEAKQQ